MPGRCPHILLIVADDLSAGDLGVYGHPSRPTPNLQALAARGALFNAAWMTPLCRPSRATLMTGWYGPKIGYLSNTRRPKPDTIAAIGTLGHAMQSSGYRTAMVGKWQHDPTPASCGFDEHFIWQLWDGYDGPVEDASATVPGRPARYWHPALVENEVGVPTGSDDYGPDLVAQWTVDFIKRSASAPTFVLHNELLIHRSWHFGLGKEGYIPIPGEDRSRLGSIASNIGYFDELVGRVVGDLGAAGIVPLLIVTSDNGTFGWGKRVLKKQRGPRVALLAAGDAVSPGARDQLVDSSDFFPTLCHLACGGGALRDGLSFAPILADPAHVGREWAYSWLGDHDFVRTGRWLLDGENNLFERRPGGAFVAADDSAAARRARRELEQIAADIRASELPSS